MNQFILFILVLIFLFSFSDVQAQSSSSEDDMTSQDDVTNFQPSLAVVIGILAILFSLTFLLLVYAKFCHRASSSVHQQSLDGLIRSGSRFSGIDKTVIESLPFFRFSSLRGLRGGLECAVCLSKFEDIEILRLLPKCKHAFHINCVDQWLEKHSSCPICRQKISADDMALITYSNSLRFLSSQSEPRQDSSIELFVQREEDRHGSSRFSIGSSFRKFERGKKEEELPMQESFCGGGGGGGGDDDDVDDKQKHFHRHNHKIVVSGAVLMNHRWSNLSSSDLMFLNSEMLHDTSSNRFSSLGTSIEQSSITRVVQGGGITRIKEEMERKRDFETKVNRIAKNDSFPDASNTNLNYGTRVMNPNDKRSMSEITVHPRFTDFGLKNGVRESSLPENDAKEERLKRLWLPIARKTVQWFANRESRSQQLQNTRQSLNV